ncbi:MAG: sigma-70 family RNA polymerase sigma factor [Acidimicrobiales bacterium]|nr:sigma-70 family RNA polymerase sigma factor [Acidimicrobiales bacterium]MXX41806.1 sigma-70 family RNA polymerase sigma factor [Acidimicrobiales bacterium]MXZ14638.1 sigma-70 family RNA polymerase sigma factor [Acidimicrobiales bacterium]MYB82094.1 sigma-70 family RNA polymerase sigma factor [Acidimicrobiales bacterium]MYG62251.1 sigma-70 family RNA polymerase sigma factor [Acidimicrobiales bacterium]
MYTLCRRTLDESRACDVAQEVFISAWKGHERFDPAKGNLAAWLVTITKNRIIDNIRAAKRHSDRRSGADLADTPSDAGIEQIAERLMIAEALRRLPEATRRVITMHYFDGLTHPQIAETTSRTTDVSASCSSTRRCQPPGPAPTSRHGSFSPTITATSPTWCRSAS